MRQKNQNHWLFQTALAGLILLFGGCDSGVDGVDGLAADGGRGDVGADGGVEGADGGSPTAYEGVNEGDVLAFLANPERGDLVDDLATGAPPEFDAGLVGSDAAYLQVAQECYAPSGGAAACSDASCGLLAACCVGDGNCCSPVGAPPLATFDFGACDGLTAAQCAVNVGTTAEPFGPTLPTITEDGLTPNGTLTADGGALFESPVDLTSQRVELSMRFSAPDTCGGTCLESVGVGFTAQPEFGIAELVEPEVALLYSAAFESVSLVVRGAAVQSWSAGSLSDDWSLVVRPDGVVEVLRGTGTLTERAFATDGLQSVRLVVYGRNLNGSGAHAALQMLNTQVELCDIPSSWTPTEAVDLDGRRPSIASDGVERRIAVDLDGEIFWATQDGSPESFTLIGAEAALSPTRPYEAGGVRDPELLWDGTQWHLFYTAVSAAGTRSIGHATAGAGDTGFVSDTTPALEASADEVHIEAPAVYHRPGLWVIVARVELDGGASALRLFESPMLGLGFSEIESSTLSTLTRVEAGAGDVTDPSLIVHDSGYQLYVAERSGTLWSISLLTSDELFAWRSVGTVLEAEATFGAREPAALSEGDRIDLYYVEDDGANAPLQWTSRAAASDSVPVP